MTNLLTELEATDHIERVNGPSDWTVSNIVITPKVDPTQIRMNVDMTAGNKAIKRTRHVIPIIEERRDKLNGAAHFLNLDMNHVFNQFDITKQPSHITVFYTQSLP